MRKQRRENCGMVAFAANIGAFCPTIPRFYLKKARNLRSNPKNQYLDTNRQKITYILIFCFAYESFFYAFFYKKIHKNVFCVQNTCESGL